MSDLQTLLDMGFPEPRARRALVKTGHKGAQVAMDWLFDHADDADIDDPVDEVRLLCCCAQCLHTHIYHKYTTLHACTHSRAAQNLVY